MSKLTEKAKEYTAKGLSVLPTDKDKKPVTAWKKYQTELITQEEIENYFSRSSVAGIAIITGAISGNLEVIDVDSKYDLSRSSENEIGDLWRDLSSTLEQSLPNVFKSLVIAKTRGGGYHIYYRCSSIAGNLKLSNRYTTPLERADEPADKTRVLIETRGEGGYVIAPPTQGYEYIQGNLNDIPTITPQDRDTILNISRSFNEVEVEEPKPVVTKPTPTGSSFTGLSPWDDYNKRGDIVSLLVSKGWKIVNQTGERINLLRPGKTDSKTSGNYHTGLRVFKVWSSSTEFSTDKGYNPSQVFSLLECNGDSKETYRKLLELGYGEPYRSETPKPKKVIENKSIKIETTDTATGETATISSPGTSLKVEDLTGNEVVITSPGSEAKDEVLRAVDVLLEAGKRIYIKEAGVEVREYTYYLQAIYQKYGTISTEKGGLTDRDTDSLLDEIVILSGKLQPIDRDLFRSLFLSQPATQELGITEDSLAITVDRLTTTRDKENQAKELNSLLSKVKEHQEKGETDKALELLDSKVKEVKLKNKTTEFSKILLPTTEAQVKIEEAGLPGSLKTKYSIKYDELLLPAGAITVFAGSTGHGKTTMLINTTLNVADLYPDKQFIFFTYEERATAILQYFLNTYIDIELNSSSYEMSNRRIVRDYFKTGSTQYIAKDKLSLFEEKKREFFNTYIETGRILIKGVDYSSEELDLAIRYAMKNAQNLGGVFIDYFQLINAPGDVKRTERINSRQEELKYICLKLNRTAKDTGLPLILSAQFNREVSNLLDMHPQKIREAGDIEQIVNTLVGVWNLSKKNVNTDDKTAQKIEEKTGGGTGMYLELLKSRDLATGSSDVLRFNGKTGKIENRNRLETNPFI